MNDIDIVRKALSTYGPGEQLATLRKAALEALKRIEDALRVNPQTK